MVSLISRYFGNFFNLEERARVWAVEWGFRRPANEQHLDSYKAFLRLSKDYASWFFNMALSFLSMTFLWVTLGTLYYFDYLQLNIIFICVFVAGMLAVWSCFLVDQTAIFWAYRKEFQRDTYGSARWALPEDLKPVGYLEPAGKSPLTSIPITRFFGKYDIALPLDVFTSHVCVIAPPRAGKSSTVVMNILRQFATRGGTVVLDPKGELYNYTAKSYANVFRFDLENPDHSDFFDLFGMCRGNSTLAQQVAHYLISDTNSAAKNPIWDESANSMLACMILHLCEFIQYPQPADVFKFMADFPAKTRKRTNPFTQKTENYIPLNEAMLNSPNIEVREVWGSNFSQLSKDTYTSVSFTMLSKMAVFRDARVRQAMRPVNEFEKAKGRRIIDFNALRKMYDKNGEMRGTAIYLVIPVGDAERLKRVVGCFFAVASEVLRASGGDDQKVHTMLMLDEVGNIPIPGLQELVNIGRSMKICVFLSYQNKSQPENHYGVPTAKAILESMGTLIFLPGLKGDNAEFASNLLGDTTILQRSSRDAQRDSLDSENKSEQRRRLMLPDEIRQMTWFVEMLIIIGNQRPIRTAFPPNAKATDPLPVKPNDFSVTRTAASKQEVTDFELLFAKSINSLSGEDDGEKETTRQAQLPVPFQESQQKTLPVASDGSDEILEMGEAQNSEANSENQQIENSDQPLNSGGGEGEELFPNKDDENPAVTSPVTQVNSIIRSATEGEEVVDYQI